MKLHLNLTLRRALMAAMALVTLHTAEAALTTKYNGADAYLTGTGTLAPNDWNAIWNKNKAGALTIGTSEGSAVVDLTNSTYNKGQTIFIGGVGHNSGATTANDGTLNVGSGTKLNVAYLNIGNSMVGGTGTLTVSSGTVTTGNSIYVGVNYGSGIINVTNGGAIIVNSGAEGAVFAMSTRDARGITDTVTLTGGSITVGTEGGTKDYTAIGHSAGDAILTLESNSTATFADQTVVGEKGGSNGLIHVHSGSTLNLSSAVLGHEKGAMGAICIDGGTASATDIIAGQSGNGTIELGTTGKLTATNLTLGDQAGAVGTIEALGGSISADLLTIGDAGTGNVTSAATIAAKNIVIGNAETGIGALDSTGTITTDNLYVGYKGTGNATINGGSLAAQNAYITGTSSQLNTEAGTTTLTNATVLAGKLSTGTAGTTSVTGELILDGNGSLVNTGATSITKATIAEGASILSDAGTLTTGTVVNSGTIANAGTWNTGSSTTSTAGTIANTGSINVNGDLTTGKVTGTGSINVTTGKGNWTITDQAAQGTINNNGTITIQGAGRVDAATLTGIGTTTILVDSTTVNTAEGESIIKLSDAMNSSVKVDIDTENAAGLLGKDVDFVTLNGGLLAVNRDDFSVGEGWAIDWDNQRITTGDATSGQQLSFIGNEMGMNFTKLGAIETQKVETEEQKVSIELEVVTETVLPVIETPESKGQEVVITGSEDETDVEVKNDTIIHTAEISKGVDAETKEDIRTNVVIGKDVTSTGDNGSLKVQSVVVNQKTTIEKADGQTEEKKETIGTSGVALVLSGKSEHKGISSEGSVAELGFNENTKEGILTTKDTNTQEIIQNEVKKIDIVQVEKNSDVSISGMDMHSTHALTVKEGTTLLLSGVNLHVGGTTDINLTKEVEIKVYDETGTQIGTKTETVDSGAHLTVDSTITNATVKITDQSVVKFEKIDNENHDTAFGSTTFKASDVEIESGSVLGEDKEHMQQIVFADSSHVKNEGEIHNAKFDNGATLTNKGGMVNNVAFEDGSTMKGSGSVQNVHMKKGAKLTVGSSPGVVKATDLTVDGTVEFYLITNSKEWDSYTGDSSELSTNYETGSFSQLYVNENVILNGTATIVYQEKQADGTYADCADQSEAANSMQSVFTEGSAIQFVTGNIDSLTLGSDFYFDESCLPTLEEGMFWDLTDFLTTGIVYVESEILEEPTRVANSLVSAGETVLNFGRVAESQAALREAGTTRTWASALAVFDSIDSGNTTNGYDYNAWGAAVGVDHAFTKNTIIGAAFGCTWGENEAEYGNEFYEAGSIDQDSKMVALYGVHKFQTKGMLNDMKLSAFAAYGWFENDSTRNSIRTGEAATANWDSEAWVLSASISRDITTDDGVVFTPYVGVEYTKAGMDDFTEAGRRYEADYTAEEDYSNLSVKVGMTVSKDFDGFTPYLGVAYINDVDRSAAKVTADGKRTITGESALPGRSALQLRAGATWQLTETLDLNAGYAAELREKATEQSANVGIGLTF